MHSMDLWFSSNAIHLFCTKDFPLFAYRFPVPLALQAYCVCSNISHHKNSHSHIICDVKFVVRLPSNFTLRRRLFLCHFQFILIYAIPRIPCAEWITDMLLKLTVKRSNLTRFYYFALNFGAKSSPRRSISTHFTMYFSSFTSISEVFCTVLQVSWTAYAMPAISFAHRLFYAKWQKKKNERKEGKSWAASMRAHIHYEYTMRILDEVPFCSY